MDLNLTISAQIKKSLQKEDSLFVDLQKASGSKSDFVSLSLALESLSNAFKLYKQSGSIIKRMFFPKNFEIAKENLKIAINNYNKLAQKLGFPICDKYPDYVFFKNRDITKLPFTINYYENKCSLLESQLESQIKYTKKLKKIQKNKFIQDTLKDCPSILKEIAIKSSYSDFVLKFQEIRTNYHLQISPDSTITDILNSLTQLRKSQSVPNSVKRTISILKSTIRKTMDDIKKNTSLVQNIENAGICTSTTALLSEVQKQSNKK